MTPHHIQQSQKSQTPMSTSNMYTTDTGVPTSYVISKITDTHCQQITCAPQTLVSPHHMQSQKSQTPVTTSKHVHHRHWCPHTICNPKNHRHQCPQVKHMHHGHWCPHTICNLKNH